MTQQEALTRAQEMLPHIADVIRLCRSHSIGLHYGHDDEFVIWDHSNGDCLILANSHHSWEHALAMIAPDQVEREMGADHSAVDMPSTIALEEAQ